MENETKNIWSGCVGKKGIDCPCLNFVWKKLNRSVIYTEENLAEEFSPNYNSKSLVTILDTIQYTTDGTNMCFSSPVGSNCIPNNNCRRRPDGLIVCNTLYLPPRDRLPTLEIRYLLEYYEFHYKKCKLSSRRCICKPHSKDHYCFSYSHFTHLVKTNNFREFAEIVAKDKNNGRFQIGAYITLKYPKDSPGRNCNMRSKYSGIVMQDFPDLPGGPWSSPETKINCSMITSHGVQSPRIRCGELNFHLPIVRFEKGKPPAGTPPLIGPVKVPFM